MRRHGSKKSTGTLRPCKACNAQIRSHGRLHRRPDGKGEWCDGVHTPLRNESASLLNWAHEHLARLEVEKRYAEVIALLKPLKASVEGA